MHTIVSSAKARVRRRRYAPLLIGLGVLLPLTACHRQSEQPSAGSEPPAAPGGPKGASWSGEPLRGDSQVALRAYLTSVEEVKPTKFRVEWNPATVAIDKAAALRSLRAVSHDGTAFTLASDEPAVAKLKPGSIIWIWDIAVRKVDSMEAVGDVTHVHTSAVLLTEAIPNAEIEFETPLKLQNYYPLRTAEPATPQSTARWQRNASGFVLTSLTDLPPEHLPDPDAVSNTDEDNWYDEGMSANGYTGKKAGWTYSVGYKTRLGGISVELQARKGDIGGDERAGDKSLIPEYKAIEADRQKIHDDVEKVKQELRDEEKGIRDTDADFEKQMGQLQLDQSNRNNPGYNGPRPPPQVNEYGHPITDQAAQQRLKDQWQNKHDLEIQKLQATEQIMGEWRRKKDELDARKRALKAARGVAMQLWNIIDDNLDARIRGRVDLDGFTAGAHLAFTNGNIDAAATHFKNLNGKVYAQLIGRLGKPGNEAIKIPVMHVPVDFNVPIPIGGIPFVVQVGADFLLTMALSGLHASLAVDGQATFNGDSGFTYAKGKASYDTSFTSKEPQITMTQGMSPGVSAVVLAVQLPRVGFGLGVFLVSSVAFVDVVHVITMTQSGAVGAGMLTPMCKRTTYNSIGHVGIKTDIIPLPFVDTEKIEGKLSGKREIFNTSKEKLEPPVKGCEIH